LESLRARYRHATSLSDAGDGSSPGGDVELAGQTLRHPSVKRDRFALDLDLQQLLADDRDDFAQPHAREQLRPVLILPAKGCWNRYRAATHLTHQLTFPFLRLSLLQEFPNHPALSNAGTFPLSLSIIGQIVLETRMEESFNNPIELYKR
jgi:hypothetical protein